MEFSTLSVAHRRNSPPELWRDALRLVVVVATRSDGQGWFAYGVDPDRVTLVFQRAVPDGGLGDFLRYLVDGAPAVAGAARGAIANCQKSCSDALPWV